VACCGAVSCDCGTSPMLDWPACVPSCTPPAVDIDRIAARAGHGCRDQHYLHDGARVGTAAVFVCRSAWRPRRGALHTFRAFFHQMDSIPDRASAPRMIVRLSAPRRHPSSFVFTNEPGPERVPIDIDHRS
jgi:hypothetical protein